jgi:hypothetical protein
MAFNYRVRLESANNEQADMHAHHELSLISIPSICLFFVVAVTILFGLPATQKLCLKR